jgi:hypothetical protein
MSSSYQPSLDHDCEHGGGAVGGLLAVHQKASSSCCGEILAEGGTPEKGFSCSKCGKKCQRVLGAPTAHWTCPCGERREQVQALPAEIEG